MITTEEAHKGIRIPARRGTKAMTGAKNGDHSNPITARLKRTRDKMNDRADSLNNDRFYG